MPSLAGNDSSVWRPCAISAFSIAFHLCADFLVVVFAAFLVWDLKGIVVVIFILERVLMREGDIFHAIARFEEALRLYPDFPEAEQNLRIAKGT